MRCLSILLLFLITPVFSQSWTQVWADDFDQDGLPNPEKWDQINKLGDFDEQVQFYTKDRSENARTENGKLIIEALKESFDGNDYTSARLTTSNLFQLKYGKIEFRAKFPVGNGLQTGITLVSSSSVHGHFPNSGFMTLMGYGGSRPNEVDFVVQNALQNNFSNNPVYDSVLVDTSNNMFHDYAMEWYPDSISFFFDSEKTLTFKKSDDSWESWPFDENFNIEISVNISDLYSDGTGIDDNIFPQSLEVEYIRAYELDDDTKTSFSINTSVMNGSVQLSPDKTSYDKGDVVTIISSPDEGYKFESWGGDIRTISQDTLQIVMQHDYDIVGFFTQEDEIVLNYSFDDGLKNWTTFGFNGIEANDGQVILTMNEETDLIWHNQIFQNGIDLENGEEYLFTFTASASTERTMVAKVAESQAPWGDYYNKTIQLTITPQKFTSYFSMRGNDANARAYFEMGLFEGDITLEDVSLVKVYNDPDELIQNGSFSRGLSDWLYFGGTADVSRESFSTIITSASTNIWDEQLLQLDIPLERYTEYELIFVAFSNVERSIQVAFGQAVAPYQSYHTKTVDLTTSPDTLRFRFVSLFTDPEARIGFNMGQAIGNVFLDQVSLKKVGSVTPTDINDLVLNGDVIHGIDHWWVYNSTLSIQDEKLFIPVADTIYTEIAQPGIALVKGEEYTLSFEGSSSIPKTIGAGVGHTRPSFEGVVGRSYELTDTVKTFSVDFTSTIDDLFGVVYFSVGDVLGDVSLSNISIKPKRLVGLFDLKQTDRVVFYPNPSTSSIKLVEEGDWTIYDLTGNLLISGESSEIDLTSFKKGSYMIRVNEKRSILIKQ